MRATKTKSSLTFAVVAVCAGPMLGCGGSSGSLSGTSGTGGSASTGDSGGSGGSTDTGGTGSDVGGSGGSVATGGSGAVAPSGCNYITITGLQDTTGASQNIDMPDIVGAMSESGNGLLFAGSDASGTVNATFSEKAAKPMEGQTLDVSPMGDNRLTLRKTGGGAPDANCALTGSVTIDALDVASDGATVNKGAISWSGTCPEETMGSLCVSR